MSPLNDPPSNLCKSEPLPDDSEPGGAEIFLKPGEFHFGDAPARIRTLLGSCVGLTMWHPVKRLGGMSHCLLPSRANREPGARPDGRYLDEALHLFEEAAFCRRTTLPEYQIKMFGGGDMFPGTTSTPEGCIGARNVAFARRILAKRGLRLTAEHVGGNGNRAVIFDIGSGQIWFRHRLPVASGTAK